LLSEYGLAARLEHAAEDTPEGRLAADVLLLASRIGCADELVREYRKTGRRGDERENAARVHVESSSELYVILANLLGAYPDHFRQTISAIRRIGDALAKELLGTDGNPPASEDDQPAPVSADRGNEVVGQQVEGQGESGQADKETDKPKKKLRTIPENPEVLKLAKGITKGREDGRSLIDIARDFTDGNDAKAQSLLRQLRRYRDLLH
jgi:hypothetical protein